MPAGVERGLVLEINMSSKRGFPARTALAVAGVAALIVSVATPAMADGWKWKHHHGRYYAPYVVAPSYAFGGYYAPPPPVVYAAPVPVYAAPAPVYVEAPPPVVYAPPAPVYYQPPGLSVGITVPFR